MNDNLTLFKQLVAHLPFDVIAVNDNYVEVIFNENAKLNDPLIVKATAEGEYSYLCVEDDVESPVITNVYAFIASINEIIKYDRKDNYKQKPSDSARKEFIDTMQFLGARIVENYRGVVAGFNIPNSDIVLMCVYNGKYELRHINTDLEDLTFSNLADLIEALDEVIEALSNTEVNMFYDVMSKLDFVKVPVLSDNIHAVVRNLPNNESIEVIYHPDTTCYRITHTTGEIGSVQSVYYLNDVVAEVRKILNRKITIKGLQSKPFTKPLQYITTKLPKLK